jgi:hypothetical protein
MLALAITPVYGATVTLNLNGYTNAVQNGSTYTFSLGGTATITGLGTAAVNATLSGTGTVANVQSLQASSPIAGSLALVVGTQDMLVGTFNIPAGIIVPQIGGSTTATGSATILGGTGKFADAYGSLGSISGSGVATGMFTSTFTASGSGSLVTPSYPTTGVLSYVGSFAHFTSAGTWQTDIGLTNLGTTAAQVHVAFNDDSGNPVTVPVVYPQAQGTGTVQVSSVDRTIAPGAELLIELAGSPTTPQVSGSIQVTSDGFVSGSAVFRDLGGGQEAVVALETRNPSAFVLAFDNTSGLTTGLAVENVSAQAATVNAIVKDDNGTILFTVPINLPAHGHVAYTIQDTALFAGTKNRRGTITLQTPAGGQIAVLGLRFTLPRFTITSIPPLALP